MKNNPNDPYTENVLKEFDEKFVKPVTKQVDTSNSIVLPLWKNSHAFLSRDIKEFIKLTLLTQRNEIKERIEGMKKKLYWLNCPFHDRTTSIEELKKCEACEWEPKELENRSFNEALTAAIRAVDGEEK